jgi:hypothetical protein
MRICSLDIFTQLTEGLLENLRLSTDKAIPVTGREGP